MPVSRSIAHQRIALEMLTPNRAAADRRDDPAATAATTRSLRSTDSALDMPVGLPADRQFESDQAGVGESPSDSVSQENALVDKP